MARVDPVNTVTALSELTKRQGGSLFFQSEDSLANFKNWVAAVRLPADYKPFIISIYDTDKKKDVVTLYMMVNPHDITFGQTFNASNVYTRVGWISSLWGNNQATITANGSTAGFYYVTPNYEGGITNFNRKRSVSFMNFMSVISLFRNNGRYYMDPIENPNLYKDGHSRVINVMDTVKISYDGSDYFGSFATLSLNDIAETPYRMEYTIEFMIACFGPDFDKIDGHVKKNGNEASNKIKYAIQGQNTDFDEVVQMNKTELNTWFIPQHIGFLDDFGRGSVIEGEAPKERRTGTKYLTDSGKNRVPRVDASTYLIDHPDVDSKLTSFCNKLGVSKSTSFNQILFETGGTCDPKIGNPASTALGFIQIIDSSARMVAARLEHEGKISWEQFKSVKTSMDLCSIPPYDTPAGQIDIMSTYYDVTTVNVPAGASGGPYKGSASTYIASLKDPEEKRAALYMTIFCPIAVGQPLDKHFSQIYAERGKTWDQSKNSGIFTPQGYLNHVDSNVNDLMKNKKTMATASTTGKSS
jgi:hypothetical protein